VDISSLDLEEIARSCIQESERYFRGRANDPRFCFELFRRAFVKHDQTAWEHLYRIYQPLIYKWINSHPAFEDSREEVDYFANRTFDKVWSSITPAKFSNFKELNALLSYIKMCVGSVILDHIRTKEKMDLEALEDTDTGGLHTTDSAVENQVIDLLGAKELWQRIKACLSDRQEYIVVYACFVLDLKPREILLQFPGVYADIGEVYRNKENVMDKLRRNSELTKLLGEISVETG